MSQKHPKHEKKHLEWVVGFGIFLQCFDKCLQVFMTVVQVSKNCWHFLSHFRCSYDLKAVDNEMIFPRKPFGHNSAPWRRMGTELGVSCALGFVKPFLEALEGFPQDNKESLKPNRVWEMPFLFAYRILWSLESRSLQRIYHWICCRVCSVATDRLSD